MMTTELHALAQAFRLAWQKRIARAVDEIDGPRDVLLPSLR